MSEDRHNKTINVYNQKLCQITKTLVYRTTKPIKNPRQKMERFKYAIAVDLRKVYYHIHLTKPHKNYAVKFYPGVGTAMSGFPWALSPHLICFRRQ